MAGRGQAGSALLAPAVLLPTAQAVVMAPPGGLGCGLRTRPLSSPGLAAGPPGKKAQARLTDGSLPRGEGTGRHISSTFRARANLGRRQKEPFVLGTQQAQRSQLTHVSTRPDCPLLPQLLRPGKCRFTEGTAPDPKASAGSETCSPWACANTSLLSLRADQS